MTLADLHVHTTASDGQLTPEAVVALANQYKLTAIAITDHDTTSGVVQVSDSLLTIIPGIELGALEGERKIDILGYFIDVDHTGLQQHLARFQTDRYQRGRAIVDRLAVLDLPLDWDRVLGFAQGEAVGRPHIARALVEAGYVRSVPDAFERYIGSNRPAYVPRSAPTPEEAIQLIHDADGAAVLAHPVFVPDFPTVVERLVPVGLDGIEVNYPEHTPEVSDCARELARKYDLVMTGGSDFHGSDAKPMLGAALAPDGAVEALRERASYSRFSPG